MLNPKNAKRKMSGLSLTFRFTIPPLLLDGFSCLREAWSITGRFDFLERVTHLELLGIANAKGSAAVIFADINRILLYAR